MNWNVNLVFGVLVMVGMQGCNSEQEFVESDWAQTESTDSTVAETTEELAQDATEEVQAEETCQADEPDLAAIRESLIAKLTALIAKMEAMDLSDRSGEEQAKHAELIAQLKRDLETVTQATELSDELKTIADRFWKKSQARRQVASFHHGGRGGKPGPGRGCEEREPARDEQACVNQVKKGHKDAQCKNIEQLLEKDDLSVELRAALEARYTDACGSA